MEKEEFNNYFKNELKKNKIDLNPDNEKFYKYMKNTLEWNEKINLTNIKDEKEFVVKHFIDSLTILKYIDKNKKLIDIGCGAGFPGIPLKLAEESLESTLIDSLNKKISTVKDSIEKIGLEKIEAIHCRAEELAKKEEFREKFDYATTRAVSNLSTIAEYMIPFLKIGGLAICMKGPNCIEEINEAKTAINTLGGKIEKIDNIIIDDEFERNIIIIRKIKETPLKYPRENGKPLKNPIK